MARAQKGGVYEPAVPEVSNDYVLGPDSKPQPNAPAGKVFAFQMEGSKIFPGTTRKITVYIPAAYKAGKRACVYVGLDGLGFQAPIVFDNLIAQHAIPVTIGIGVAPGVVPSSSGGENPRFDRSLEFDSMDDRLSRFLVEEVLPEVERHKTPDGDPIMLSKDPNDRAIGGASTGGIAAFNVAWERPDQFRRVFTAIGTFLGMRGGERFNVLVRKTEPKPLRIFQTDGVHDEWPGGPEIGDWWMSNLTMNRALEFAGYDVKHVWGTGSHNSNQASAIFPEAMRWLWRDYPAPVQAKQPGNPRLHEIAVPGKSWVLVPSDPGGTTIAVGLSGELISCGHRKGESVAVGPDGSCYVALVDGGIAIRSQAGSEKGLVAKGLVAKGLVLDSLIVDPHCNIYATTMRGRAGGELWLIRENGTTLKLDDGIRGPSAVALSPDGLWLLVSQTEGHQELSYRLKADGTVDSREPLYEISVPDAVEDSGATGIAVDRNGWFYFATRLGLQICDRNGRVTVILPLPIQERVSSVAFGGKDFKTLYVVTDKGKLYKRELKISGVPAFASRIELPPWGAG